MRDYYTDFLQTKISVDTLPSEVSKVSKGQVMVKKQAFDTFDTTLPGVYQKNNYPKNNGELAEFKSGKLHEILNRFIEAGITFDVSADEFQTIDANRILKTSDEEFLEINSAAILCTLHQSLLVKHLFNHSPEQFEDFAFEIAEREAIMTGDGRECFSIHYEAVKDVSKNWFAGLIETGRKE